jgi:hypothetical protein
MLLGCSSADDSSAESGGAAISADNPSGGEAASAAPSARHTFRCTGKQVERLGVPGSFTTAGGGQRAGDFDVTLAPGAAAVLAITAKNGVTTLSVLSPDGKTRSAVAQGDVDLNQATLANSWTADKTYHVSARAGPTGDGTLISFCTTLTDAMQPTPDVGGCKAVQPTQSCKTEGGQPGTCVVNEYWTNVGDDYAVGKCQAK